MLNIYLRLDISNNLSRARACLRLSGHNFLDSFERRDAPCQLTSEQLGTAEIKS
jgi:hypothetical protein